MKISRYFRLLGAAAVLAFSGCDFGTVAEISAQLRQPQRYFGLNREDNGFTVRFYHPTIRRADLSALGLPHVIATDPIAQITYALEVNGAGRRDVAVTLRFGGDFLESVTLPVILYDLLGRPNIEHVLRVAGGASMAGWSVDPITPAAIRSGLTNAGFASDPLVDLITVKLAPATAGARSLVLKIQRHPPDESYREITVSFRK